VKGIKNLQNAAWTISGKREIKVQKDRQTEEIVRYRLGERQTERET